MEFGTRIQIETQRPSSAYTEADGQTSWHWFGASHGGHRILHYYFVNADGSKTLAISPVRIETDGDLRNEFESPRFGHGTLWESFEKFTHPCFMNSCFTLIDSLQRRNSSGTEWEHLNLEWALQNLNAPQIEDNILSRRQGADVAISRLRNLAGIFGYQMAGEHELKEGVPNFDQATSYLSSGKIVVAAFAELGDSMHSASIGVVDHSRDILLASPIPNPVRYQGNSLIPGRWNHVLPIVAAAKLPGGHFVLFRESGSSLYGARNLLDFYNQSNNRFYYFWRP